MGVEHGRLAGGATPFDDAADRERVWQACESGKTVAQIVNATGLSVLFVEDAVDALSNLGRLVQRTPGAKNPVYRKAHGGPPRAVADLTDDEIVSTIARLFGIDGFDAEDDEQAWFDLSQAVGVDFDDDDAADVLQDRIGALVNGKHLREVGCGWVAPTLGWWGQHLAGKSAEEIEVALSGRWFRGTDTAALLRGEG